MSLSRFHPLIAEWFHRQVGRPTDVQVQAWPVIQSGAASHDIKLSASDPLNLAGVILPGPRVPAVPSNFVVFRDGAVVRAVLGREAADRPSEQIEWSGRANQVSPHYS
jgi:hypothetical protein